MESILHIEPLVSEIKNEQSIGDTSFVYYGNGDLEEDDDVGHVAGRIRLGAPIEPIPGGPESQVIKLIKTFEYYPDPSGRFENIFSDTIHLHHDKKFIPIRTSVRVGPSDMMKYSHLPSLDFARTYLTGSFPSAEASYVVDPISQMVDNLLTYDRMCKAKSRHPIIEWAKDDLIHILSKQYLVNSLFDGNFLIDRIIKFRNRIEDAPYTDLSPRYVSDLLKTLIVSKESVPNSYLTESPIRTTPAEFKLRTSSYFGNLKSYGSLQFSDKSSIEVNPKRFPFTLGYLDDFNFTDLNIDIIFADGRIVKTYPHVVEDRIVRIAFDFNELENPHNYIEDMITCDDITTILREFVHAYNYQDHVVKTIMNEPLKIKIIKTITDQVAFLIYKFHTGPNDPPLCGVHFDIPLLALAPMSVVPAIVPTMANQ